MVGERWGRPCDGGSGSSSAQRRPVLHKPTSTAHEDHMTSFNSESGAFAQEKCGEGRTGREQHLDVRLLLAEARHLGDSVRKARVAGSQHEERSERGGAAQLWA